LDKTFYFDRPDFCVELTYFARESANIEIWKGDQIIKPVFVLPVGTSWQTERLQNNFEVGSYTLRISTYANINNFLIGDFNFCPQSGIFIKYSLQNLICILTFADSLEIAEKISVGGDIISCQSLSTNEVTALSKIDSSKRGNNWEKS